MDAVYGRLSTASYGCGYETTRTVYVAAAWPYGTLKEPGRRSSRVRVNTAFAQRYHGPLRPLHAVPPLASTTEGLMPIDRGQQRRAAKYGWLGNLMGMHPNEEAICRDGRCPPDEAVFDTRLPRPPW
ncbi:hypothetical protein B0H10DRAFT_2444012 [Mycena sp. CBHHK59/15]|nr:hypothetical protein B0H10DRAFT_2444012 [Mycena sp. CBHHK59/15]